MRNRLLGAVGCGTVVLCLSQWVMETRAYVIVNGPSNTPSEAQLAALALLTSLAAIAPGLCAGLVSGTRGILAGALTGLVGIVVYSFARFFLLIQHSTFHLTHRALVPLLFIVIWVLPSLVYCTAGGAMGELLRSNNRWRGPIRG